MKHIRLFKLSLALPAVLLFIWWFSVHASSSYETANSSTPPNTVPSGPSDWPQWRGPERNGVSKDTGLLKQWPSSGPQQSWSISSLGEGFGSIAIRGDRIFIQGTSSSASMIFCLNRADGKTVWSAALGPKLNESVGNGPRSTPTVDNDRVYVLTENGDLACLRAGDGSPVWRKNILKEFGGSNPGWLISESPLLDGDRVIVTPGGRGAGMVALDKMTGKEIWRAEMPTVESAGGFGSGVSPILADGTVVLVRDTMKESKIIALDAATGKVRWEKKRQSPASLAACSARTKYFWAVG